MNNSRRNFLRRSSIIGAGALATATVSKVASAQHEGHTPQAPPKTDNRSMASAGGVLVQTPDLPKLPWRMEGGVKVFHLTAEVVKMQLIPGKEIFAWGYNGSCPGPTIEAHEGDRVRFVFHNKLPESTTVHWHGLELPINMDGQPYVSQPPVEPGGMFTYEFDLHQNGTFFYHSHGAMQEMMGMLGLFIIHPKQPNSPRVDKDFGLILQEWALLPNNPVPNTLAMEFNWLTINGKAGPACTPMIVKQGERVRIRIINIGMDHHPIHVHGHQFYVTGTEGGRIPESAWYPGNTVLVGVAQARDVEFDAVYPGDWMLHCHLPHHMMNQMVSMVGMMGNAGRGVPTGGGMEEGMGVIRQGHALSEDMGPSLGRGMGDTTHRERNTSNLVGQGNQNPHAGHTGQSPAQGKGTEVQPGQQTLLGNQNAKRVPGYPQDMFMFMDKEVAKPENNGLAPGWSGAMMGMMNFVRVLPPDRYEQIMADIREGRVRGQDGQQPATQHQHNHE